MLNELLPVSVTSLPMDVQLSLDYCNTEMMIDDDDSHQILGL